MNTTKTSELCRLWHSSDIADTIKIADDVADKSFVFTLRWDMECTHTPVRFPCEIDWEYQPGDDLEWTVMLSRHRYMVCVAQAYALSGGAKKYLDLFVDTITGFIKNVPLAGSEGKNTWRTIDSGIRARNWVWGLDIISRAAAEHGAALPEDFLELIAASLCEHLRYLLDCYNDTHFMSNWGVLANSGALSAAFYLQNNALRDCEADIALLLERLDEQAEVQVLGDGWQWEQSPMYHHEVLWCYLENILLLRENSRKPSDTVLRQTLSMCRATLYSANPRHHQLMRCDSDDTDIRDILTLGAYIFGDGALRFGAYEKLDFDNLWRLGDKAAADYAAIEPCTPPLPGPDMRESGNRVWRSGWEENATMLAMRCGALGGGHSHADLFHIDLIHGGEDVLIDSGRFTYVNNEDRLFLKSAEAHNTFTVDNAPFTDCVASWRFGETARAVRSDCFQNERYYYLSASHLGYISKGVYVRRQLVLIRPDILIICDSVYGSGEHTLQHSFNFNNAGELNIMGKNYSLYKSSGTLASLTVVEKSAELSILPSRISRHYNSSEESHCLEVRRTVAAPGAVLTVIGLGDAAGLRIEKLPVLQPREHKTLDDSRAVALAITEGERRYTAIFSITDPLGGINLLSAGGERGYGEVMLFDSEHRRTVLSY